MKINCVITDDEPIALEIMEDYVKLIPGLNLVAKCHDAMETLSALRNNDVDLLFIDIQMPEINGLELVKSLKKPPLIVLTTAYPNYAIEGFEMDVTDYVLKPLSVERFLRTMDKVYNRLGWKNSAKNTQENKDERNTGIKDYFFVRSNAELVKINYNKILYVEGLENYVKIVCEDKNIVTLQTMKNMEDILNFSNFQRIHRSYIINLDKVDSVQENAFRIRDKSITIGKSYRKIVLDILRMSNPI